jgi:hypothetical protein
MRRVLFGSAVAVLFLLVFAGPASAQAKQHTFFVHVTDASGAPIPNLGPTDFGIIEGGQARKVLRATFGGSPARILFLVDTSDSISRVINPWRAGAQALLDGLPPEDEVAMASIGAHMRIRVQPPEKGKNSDPAADRKKLKSEAGSLFSEGGGSVLLDGLREANDRLLAKFDDRTAIVVMMITDGPEISTATREEEFNKMMLSFVNRRAVVHAVVLGNGGTGTTGLVGGSTASAGLQHVVAQNLTQNTGGQLENVAVATSLADKMGGIAALIRTQQDKLKGWYQIDYASDTPGGGNALDVTISRMDAKFELSDGPPK